MDVTSLGTMVSSHSGYFFNCRNLNSDESEEEVVVHIHRTTYLVNLCKYYNGETHWEHLIYPTCSSSIKQDTVRSLGLNDTMCFIPAVSSTDSKERAPSNHI